MHVMTASSAGIALCTVAVPLPWTLGYHWFFVLWQDKDLGNERGGAAGLQRLAAVGASDLPATGTMLPHEASHSC